MIKEFFNKEALPFIGNADDPSTYLYKLKENGLIIHRVYFDIGLKEENLYKNNACINDDHNIFIR